MINATLCTTSNTEPWAANVDFAVDGANWSTTLNSNYAHYQNLAANNKLVIAYKIPGLELIAKGIAELSQPDTEGFAPVAITLTWLRFVENDSIQDFDSPEQIAKIITTRLP